MQCFLSNRCIISSHKAPAQKKPLHPQDSQMEPGLTYHTLLGQQWWEGKTAACAKFILKLLFIQSNKAFSSSPGAVLQSGEQKWLCYRNAAPWSCLNTNCQLHRVPSTVVKHQPWQNTQIWGSNARGWDTALWWSHPKQGQLLKGWDLSPFCTSIALAAGLISKGPEATPFLPGVNSS